MMNMVILLNFLIAIISQSYETVISNGMTHEYEHKAALNIERLQFFQSIKLNTQFNLLCTVSCYEEDLMKGDEIAGLTYTLKNMIKKQLSKMHVDLNSRINGIDAN